ncbi:DUF3048 domain-containing protein [Patescibacteria group bacterium]|nr:DUF3048 domain-containing protein [Patescibacteria group bacterium]
MKSFRQFIQRMREKYEPVDRLASFVTRGREKKYGLKRYKSIWAGSVFALLLIGLIALGIYSTVERVSDLGLVPGSSDLAQAVEDPRHPLTGERIAEPYKTLPQVFGVMVENSSDAWPLVGLDQAFLVIEAPVEAGIPRLLAFFSEESEVEKIGPVRSARAYYLDWNDELDAVYAHVGGSPEAMDFIKYDYDTIDLDQFWQREYFYRTNHLRYAPHNVFTSSELLIYALDEFNLDQPSYDLWTFKDDHPVEQDTQSLKVDFVQGNTYDIDWRYDPETNTYTRYEGGSLMEMEDGAQTIANNIVVIATDIRTIDHLGRKRIMTVGEGDALIAQDGEVFLGRWKKDQRTGRLKFFTHDGFEISMNAGATWIEIVSSLSQVEPYQE